MAPAEDETADRLDRYLDGVVRGWPPGGAGLDPALAAAARRVHARRAAPGPDAAFVARLEEELMHDTARTNGQFPPSFPIGRWAAVAVPPAATPRRSAGRWPLTELVVAAVVLLAIASGIGAYRLGPEEPSGEARFGASLTGTPAPSGGAACTLEPRAVPIVRSGAVGTPIGLPGTPVATLTLPTGDPLSLSADPPGVPEESLPAGEPAPAVAVAGIVDALVQFAVCRGEAGLAIYSDDYFRRFGTGLPFDDGVSRVLWPMPLRGVERGEDVRLRDARVLPDGRIGAVVETPGMGPAYLGNFFVFVEGEDGWLLDEFVVVRRSTASDGAAPPPTTTPKAFMPTHQIQGGESINLRPDPSFDHPPIRALAPTTPLQYLDEEAPTATPAADGARWMRFRIADGAEGWVREIDVEPYRG